KTPAFDRVAKAGALVHTCLAGSPGCSPSRAALLTGRHPWQIEQAGTHASSFPKTYQVYPDILEQAGYFVGYTGKGWGPGNWKASGRDRNPCGPVFSDIRGDAPQGINRIDYAANFAKFLNEKPADAPFCFWYGATEPHRAYKKGAGLEQGKKLADARVPSFLPDTPEIRSDILDYYVEIEWFDSHLARILNTLEETGELDNTLVIVTADNGMPFPRAKANGYEFGVHVPLAIMWNGVIAPGTEIRAPVDFVDFAPTILEAVGMSKSIAMTGDSLLPLIHGEPKTLGPAFSSRERHSSSRHDNLTYPIRSMRTDDYLLIWHARPDRWPAGDPPGVKGDAFGYYDIDGCPSKTFLWENRDDPKLGEYFRLAVDKRDEWELYDARTDTGNLHNLATDSQYKETFETLRSQMIDYLRKTGDPRVIDGGEIFESYIRYSAIREFPAE
ncbi:MAG TPA: sulfatase, partial [Planctomycetaceae bacterium]|nr:sulfatase [Planctomycetaceae bacterium]